MFVSGEATILHADVDSFFASVEQRDDPRLRGRPVIVGSWVVLAASYEAKAYGIRTAMSGSAGPPAVPAGDRGRAALRGLHRGEPAMYRVFDDTTPLVEGLSIDEAFLDVRGMERDLRARRARSPCGCGATCCERVGLPITVGVARTKFLAKVASGVAKPDGLLVVPPDGELAFLHPLPVERLWGVGPVTVAQAPRARDRDRRRGGALSRGGARAAARAGPGPSPPRPRPQPRSAAGARSAAGGARSARSARSGARRKSPEAIDAALVALVDRVTRRMRAAAARRPHRRAAPALRRLHARDALAHAAARDARAPQTILAAARGLLATAVPLIERQGLTLVGIAVTNLDDERAVQLDAAVRARRRAARSTRRSTRCATRFGASAVTRAVLLGRDQGLTMPLLPD